MCEYLAVGPIFTHKWSPRSFLTKLFHCFEFALSLVYAATFELKEFLARARGGSIRILKIVIRNGNSDHVFRAQKNLFEVGCLTVFVHSCFFHRRVGARFIQRAGADLGQGLRSVSASSSHTSGALLHPLPPGLPECTGLRVDIHLLVT